MYKIFKYKKKLYRLDIVRVKKILYAIIFISLALVGTVLLMRFRKNRQVAYQAGVEKFSNGDFDGAIDSLKKTGDGKNDADALFKLAVSYYNQKKYDEAMDSYNKLLGYDPQNFLAYNGLANIYRDQKNNDRAIENYQQAIKVNPSFPLAYSNLSIMLLDLGRKEEARKVVDDGLKNVPNYQELKNIAALLDK